MFRELMSLFRSDDVISEAREILLQMLELSRDLTLVAGKHYFDDPATPEELTAVHRRDVELNKLQRKLRKLVITHLTLSTGKRDAAHGLMLMSVVKDVERIGDYCKNMVDVYDDGGSALPDDENAAELRGIRAIVEDLCTATPDVMRQSDSSTALELIRRGRDSNKRCDALVKRIAQGPYGASTTTTLVLGTRYYKRIQSHLLNVLSSVVMPLHKLDYYDEGALAGDEG